MADPPAGASATAPGPAGDGRMVRWRGTAASTLFGIKQERQTKNVDIDSFDSINQPTKSREYTCIETAVKLNQVRKSA